ncbi:MAG TPA: hypothetical protein VLA90_09775, partial [Actinomycetota bacterium]|nr:hypothetical protein [Actinomycetota bacterium]
IRRAQDEVRKTVEVSFDADEPRPSPPPRTTAGPPNARPTAPLGEGEEAATPPDEASAMTEVSRTLGRGLAELRRAREEVQRSFHVDLGGARSPVGSGPTASEGDGDPSSAPEDASPPDQRPAT